MLENNAEHKICTVCGVSKTFDNFSKRTRGKYGINCRCRDCDKVIGIRKRADWAKNNEHRDPFDNSFKYCPACKKELRRLKENWSCNRNSKDGLNGYCKCCTNHRNARIDHDITTRICHLWSRQKTRHGKEDHNGWVEYSPEQWEELLATQHGRCAISGVKLTPYNVSIDHIKPRSKGGGHDFGNLRLVTIRINKALLTDTDEEFIKMCKQVIQWQKRIKTFMRPDDPESTKNDL